MNLDQLKDASLLALFRQEAQAQTQVLNAGLLILERNPTQAAQLEACMRATHSLKGAARIVELDAAVQLAHTMEDLLVAAQKSELRLTASHIDSLLRGTDALLQLSEGKAQPELAVLLADLNAGFTATDAAPQPQPQPQLATRPTSMAREQAPIAAGTPVQPQPAKPAAPAAQVLLGAQALFAGQEEASRPERTADAPGRALRISAERLNHLLDLSSHSLVAAARAKPLSDNLQRLKRQQYQAQQQVSQLRELALEWSLDSALQERLLTLGQTLSEAQAQLQQHSEAFDEFAWAGSKRSQTLYDAALASRMRPCSDLMSGKARMLRDLAKSLGKQVRLELEGEQVQADRELLERLEAPLIHLLRNALDHGIEAPEQRRLHGKAEEGLLRIRARHSAGKLILDVQDDGAGIDLEKVRAAVIQRQLASEETAVRLQDDELLAFIFLPGFSLSEQLSEVSGRGVGLDAVQYELRQLRGSVTLSQQQGQGACFRLELPITLSVLRSLVVSIGGEAYALPLGHIEHSRRLAPEDIVMLEGQQHIWHQGEPVGLVAASQVLQLPANAVDPLGLPVVILRSRQGLHALAVERFIGEQNLVVMPLDPRLGHWRDLAAGALLNDGSPVLILDAESLLGSIARLLDTGQVNQVSRRNPQEALPRKRVLVVDDSLTVRELERKLLASRGYDVQVAVDGMDGWNLLRSEDFQLLVTDIDMPRMDGIELVSLVRRDARLQSLPVMVVSYKDREEDKRRGMEAGADYYLAKSSFHDASLLDAVQTLIGEAIE